MDGSRGGGVERAALLRSGEVRDEEIEDDNAGGLLHIEQMKGKVRRQG